MTRSPYAVTSALIVACPGCKAPIVQRCVSKRKPSYDLAHYHPARRKAADEQRTREVNSSIAKKDTP